jgi:hypothetical protein
MSVTVTGDAIVLDGTCGVEEADTLLRQLEEQPHLPIALEPSVMLHTAVWQVLLMAGRDLRRVPQVSSSADLILAAIERNREFSGG